MHPTAIYCNLIKVCFYAISSAIRNFACASHVADVILDAPLAESKVLARIAAYVVDPLVNPLAGIHSVASPPSSPSQHEPDVDSNVSDLPPAEAVTTARTAMSLSAALLAGTGLGAALNRATSPPSQPVPPDDAYLSSNRYTPLPTSRMPYRHPPIPLRP